MELSIILSCYAADRLIDDYINYYNKNLASPERVLIVVDFPASHGNPAHVRAAIERAQNLEYIESNQHLSVYGAWNLGVQASQTPFVANLNLDDRVSSTYYGLALEALKTSESDVVSSYSLRSVEVGDFSDTAVKQEHLPVSRVDGDGYIHYGLEDLVTLTGGKLQKNCAPHCAPVWRRSLHDHHGYFDSAGYDFVADYEFWLRLAAAGRKFVLIPSYETSFYCDTGTASDRLMHSESQTIIDAWEPSFPPPGYQETHLGRPHDLLHYCLNMNAIAGNPVYIDHLADQLITTEYGQGYFAAANLHKLKSLHNRHLGERALLLCNGPGLNRIEFDKIDLDSFTVVGLNKIFLGSERMGIDPKYIVAVNEKVIRQSLEEYRSVDAQVLLGNRVDPMEYINVPQVTYFNSKELPKGAQRFSPDISEYVHEGWTVTHAALQILHYMGFEKVFIVGMDHNFKQMEVGKENVASVIAGDDVDHFDPNYFGNGQAWDLPDLARSEESYAAALEAYQSSERQVFDLSVDGKCNIFPKLPAKVLYLDESLQFDDPLVSVVIPVKDGQQYLTEAIMSCFDNNEPKIEVVVVDDGSTDGTTHLVKAIQSVEPRLKLIRNNDTPGVGGARNTGIQYAQGQWISFIDADDYFEPGSIDARLQHLEEHDGTRMVHSTTKFVTEDRRPLGREIRFAKDLGVDDMFNNRSSLNGVMVDATAAKGLSFRTNLTNGEDWVYIYELLKDVQKSLFVEGSNTVYRMHGSTVNAAYVQHEERLVDAMQHIFDDPAAPPEFADARDSVVGARRLNVFLWHFLVGDVENCRAFISQEGDRLLAVPSLSVVEGALGLLVIRRYAETLDEYRQRLDPTEHLRVLSAIGLEGYAPRLHEMIVSALGLANPFPPEVQDEPLHKSKLTQLDTEALAASVVQESAVVPKEPGVMKTEAPKAPSVLAPSGVKPGTYTRVATTIERRFPVALSAGRFGMWIFRTLRNRWLPTACFAVAILLFSALIYQNPDSSLVYVGALTLLGLGAYTLLIVGYANHLNKRVIEQLSTQAQDTEKELNDIRALLMKRSADQKTNSD